MPTRSSATTPACCARSAHDRSRSFGVDSPQLGWVGQLEPTPVDVVIGRLHGVLGRAPLWLPGGPAEVRTVAVVTGGGAGYFDAAVARGVDLFVTGEPSEPAQALALEYGVHFVAAGHHATERFGVRALGAKLAELFGVEVRYIEVDNPV
jgi:putative NIF3 family GTP cyclohydrolase 1 type 2